jgi:soluble lytic murein transglycosylase-like protein
MLRIPLVAAVLLTCSMCFADPAQRPTTYDQMIAREAKIHGVPEAFVHRIVMRESRYHPGLVHNHCFGLMQLKYTTARGMGYRGDARGLLDAQTNLTYGVPYLANAYRLADGNEDRATALFSSGYYYVVTRKKMQGLLRTASSPALTPEPAPPLSRIPMR